MLIVGYFSKPASREMQDFIELDPHPLGFGSQCRSGTLIAAST